VSSMTASDTPLASSETFVARRRLMERPFTGPSYHLSRKNDLMSSCQRADHPVCLAKSEQLKQDATFPPRRHLDSDWLGS
jgi:hypothetical protein